VALTVGPLDEITRGRDHILPQLKPHRLRARDGYPGDPLVETCWTAVAEDGALVRRDRRIAHLVDVDEFGRSTSMSEVSAAFGMPVGGILVARCAMSASSPTTARTPIRSSGNSAGSGRAAITARPRCRRDRLTNSSRWKTESTHASATSPAVAASPHPRTRPCLPSRVP